MSFILDALKKSENERQRQVGPSLADVRVVRRSAERPWWVVAVAALLVINLGVLIVVLMRDGDEKSAPAGQSAQQRDNATSAQQQSYNAQSAPAQQQQYQQQSAQPYQQQSGQLDQQQRQYPQQSGQPGQPYQQQQYLQQPGQPYQQQQYSQQSGQYQPQAGQYQQPGQGYQANAMPNDPSVRSLADEARGYEEQYPEEATNPNLAGAARVPEGPPMVRQIQPPSVNPLPSQAVFEARTAASAPSGGALAGNETLPTFEDLTASGTNLPDLHLDIHVASQKPADRFVFVNMRKYLEGETLKEGPTVERITSEGVILNQRGLRFLLPRQ